MRVDFKKDIKGCVKDSVLICRFSHNENSDPLLWFLFIFALCYIILPQLINLSRLFVYKKVYKNLTIMELCLVKYKTIKKKIKYEKMKCTNEKVLPLEKNKFVYNLVSVMRKKEQKERQKGNESPKRTKKIKVSIIKKSINLNETCSGKHQKSAKIDKTLFTESVEDTDRTGRNEVKQFGNGFMKAMNRNKIIPVNQPVEDKKEEFGWDSSGVLNDIDTANCEFLDALFSKNLNTERKCIHARKPTEHK